MTKCDLINGPCACGSWHERGNGFGQPGMWPNGLPNGGDQTQPIDAVADGLVRLVELSDLTVKGGEANAAVETHNYTD